MNFVALETEEQLKEISSSKDTQLILKHNTTCSISNGVLRSLHDTEGALAGIDTIHVLDLLKHRDLSDAIAAQFGVPHQSPQVLAIKDGRCIYNEWGYDASADQTAKALGKQEAA